MAWHGMAGHIGVCYTEMVICTGMEFVWLSGERWICRACRLEYIVYTSIPYITTELYE